MSALSRLRGRSAREIASRLGQQLAILGERAGVMPELRAERRGRATGSLAGVVRAGSPTDPVAALAAFRASPNAFFGGFDDVRRTVEYARRHMPGAVDAVVRRANTIARGEISLLGYRAVRPGTPPRWKSDPQTGVTAPDVHWSRIPFLDPDRAGDHKLVWELNRHQYFMVLGRAYAYSGDERHAEVFAEHVSSWLNENEPVSGINWASSLEVGFRAMSWLWALHFFRDSKALTPKLYGRMLAHLRVHGAHASRHLSTWFSPNTHLTGEALALMQLGLVLPQLRGASHWTALGERVLLDELKRHLRADGVYFEQTTFYHRYTASFYLQAYLLAQRNHRALANVVRDPLVLAFDHLAHVTRPDGLSPLLGDDDGGRPLYLDGTGGQDFRGTLASGAHAFKRGDWAYVAGGADETALWLLGPDALEDTGLATPATRSRAFPASGIYVMRERWARESDWMLVDAGPFGALTNGHAHADALAMEVTCAGTPVLVDPGTFTYTADAAMRDWFRGAGAHSGVLVDGESSAAPAGPFTWQRVAEASATRWHAGDCADFLDAEERGFPSLGHATHRREVLAVRGAYWIVRDSLRDTRAHEMTLVFQGAPGARVTVDPKAPSASLTGGGPNGLVLRVLGTTPGNFAQSEAWSSPAYGQRLPAPNVRYTARVIPGDALITVMLPLPRHADTRVESVARAGAQQLIVTGAWGTDHVCIGPLASTIDAVQAWDGDWLWVRCDGAGRPTRFVAVGARSLTLDGEVIVPANVRPSLGTWREGERRGNEWVLDAQMPAAALLAPAGAER